MSLAALTRPFGLRALSGWLLSVIPIVSFFAMGYKMSCTQSAMSGNYELPRWRNWKELFLKGITARFIQVLWLAPAAIIFVLIYFNLKSVTNLQMMLALKNMLILFFALLLFSAIFAPASVLNYVTEGRFRSAFSFSMLKRLASKAYFKGWLLAGMYFAVIITILITFFYELGQLVSQANAAIAAIVFLIEVAILWFSSITLWTLLGEAWGKSIAREYGATR